MVVNQHQQQTLSLFCETLLYGVFCVVIAMVVHILATDKRLPLTRKILFSLSIVLFLLTTVHVSLVLYAVYVVNGSIKVTQARETIAMVTGFLGDLILVWRVWVVWAKRWWIVIIPFTASLTAFIIGIISAAVLISSNELNKLLPIPTAALSLTGTAVNTLFIVGRLVYQQWKTNRVMRSAGSYSSSNYLKGIILLVLESGAVLVSANIAAMVLGKLNNTAEIVVLDAIAPLLGLAPTAAIVPAHLDLAVGNHTSQHYAETLSAIHFGSNTGRRPNRALESTTTDSLPTVEQSRENIPVKVARKDTNDSDEMDKKANTEVHEVFQFVPDRDAV